MKQARRIAKHRGSMTAREFNKVISLFPTMDEHLQTMCRAVLVDGLSDEQAGEAAGVSRQLSARYTNKVYKAYLTKIVNCPADWRTVTVCVPPELADEILDRAEQVKIAYLEESSE